MTCLNIDYPDFEAYMSRALNSATRRKLRKKFKAAAAATPPIDMTILDDVTSIVTTISIRCNLEVYDRSKFHFEKLTPSSFCGLGRLMPDKVRFFLWSQNERIVAFTLCMIEGDAFCT